MSMVSVRLADGLEEGLDELVESGNFKDKTDAFHEAVRMLLLRYDNLDH